MYVRSYAQASFYYSLKHKELNFVPRVLSVMYKTTTLQQKSLEKRNSGQCLAYMEEFYVHGATRLKKEVFYEKRKKYCISRSINLE